MGDVFYLARHVRASMSSGRKNSSIGTSPPDNSLSRLARRSEASLRPAKRLRRCDSEQPAAVATAATVLSLRSIHEAIGCDMKPSISGRNNKVKPEIFPPEMNSETNELVKCGMAKRSAPEPRKIFLQDWMDREEIGPSELAEYAGCTQGYVSSIAGNRKKNPNVLYLLKISERLGVTVNDLYLPPPPKAQIVAMQSYSTQARETILNLPRRQR